MSTIPTFITLSFCLLCFIYLSILIVLGIKKEPKIIQNKNKDIIVIALFPYRSFRKGLFYLWLANFIVWATITANYYWNFQISYKNNIFLIITFILLFLLSKTYINWTNKENKLRQLIIYKDRIRYAHFKKAPEDMIFPFSIFIPIRKMKLGYKEILLNSISNIHLERRKSFLGIKGFHAAIIVEFKNNKNRKTTLPLFLFNPTQYRFVFFLLHQKLDTFKKT